MNKAVSYQLSALSFQLKIEEHGGPWLKAER